MGSRRGPERTIGQNFTMKLLLAFCLLGLAAGSEDYKMFMKWAKTKAMESCWGEDNMKIYTVNMKKAVAKCQQQDAPELDLPPFRAINRLINNMVGMAGYEEDEHHEMKYFMKFYRYMQMMKMMNHDDGDHHQENYGQYKPMQYNQMKDSSSDMNMMEKLEHMMKEHVEHVSNMTCVLREMNVIDQNNNIDVNAMKRDAEQYK